MAEDDPITLAYLAGCLDSDGFFTIRRDFKNVRNGKRATPEFQEMIGLRQVTDTVPKLLMETFGGSIHISKPTLVNGKPLFSWVIFSRKAANAAARLSPYLKIKTAPAKLLLDLREYKNVHPAVRGNKGRLLPRTAAESEVPNRLYCAIRLVNSGEIVT